MSRSTLNLAVLGCGSDRPEAQPYAGAVWGGGPLLLRQPRPGTAAGFSARLGGAGSFGSYAAALADERIDAVMVTTPPDSHLELALAALAQRQGRDHREAGAAPVAGLRGARAAEVTQPGGGCMVAENYCYKPLARVLRGIVASGCARRDPLPPHRRGEAPAVGRLARRSGRSRVAVHSSRGGCTGSTCWPTSGSESRRCTASARVTGRAPSAACWWWRSTRKAPSARSAHSWEVPSPLRGLRISRIYGTRGSVAFESNGLFVRVTGARPRLLFPGLRDIGGYRAMFRDFLTALRSGSEPLMTLARAQRGLELIEAAYRTVPSAPQPVPIA